MKIWSSNVPHSQQKARPRPQRNFSSWVLIDAPPPSALISHRPFTDTFLGHVSSWPFTLNRFINPDPSLTITHLSLSQTTPHPHPPNGLFLQIMPYCENHKKKVEVITFSPQVISEQPFTSFLLFYQGF